MTDQAYDERDDEREAQEGARGPTERDEEGKPYGSDAPEQGQDAPESQPDKP
jgi:hypothetical protein